MHHSKQKSDGFLAQLVEQWIENPCVPGSIPGETTLKPPCLGGFLNKKHQISIDLIWIIRVKVVFLQHSKQTSVGFLAQLVEQWIENPCVPGSIPGETT